MDAKDPVLYTLERLDAKRAELEEAKREAFKAYERVRTIEGDIEGYERWLEAETRGTDAPYVRRLPSIVQFPSLEVEYRTARHPPAKPKKPTNTGIVLSVIKAKPGIKMAEILPAIPKDAPLKLTRSQVYAAVSKLSEQEKIVRREDGYYPLDKAINESEATG